MVLQAIHIKLLHLTTSIGLHNTVVHGAVCFIQTADIDASGSSSWDGGAGFTPIGNNNTQFTGSYDGQAYKITGLYINRTSAEWIGLFGYVVGGTITNVKLDNVYMHAVNHVGGLIGFATGCTVTNCYSTGYCKC